AGQENIVADLLFEKIKKTKAPISTLIVSSHLRGYLIAEGNNEVEAKKVISNVPHVKGVLNKTMQMEDIKELLESKMVEITLEKGNLVEVTSGPFKGEKAKVVKLDVEKEEITVELIEVAMPIPVTIKRDAVKLVPQ
ncbi:transcription elongation factor Spt5, partial [Candidatus Micrarchaeota archaeon]|nr:transcription elongation factor Spt5 [Candidatus Micrarchaeota archaeon]